jgi:AraC-like DNA-binding protein
MPEIIEIAPAVPLRPWIEAYWTREASAAVVEERVLPDGCADIVFSVDDGAAMIVGTMTRPLFLRDRVPAFFGVRFRPGRAGAFLRLPLHEITDRSLDFRDRELAERVAQAPTAAARVTVIEAWLAQRIAEPDRRIDRAVELLAAGRAVDDVAREVNLSRQHLRRRFLQQVGVGPKTFARVARFRRLLKRVEGEASPSWAAAAADTGYFDQSHLIADFRELAGTTPVPFFLSS